MPDATSIDTILSALAKQPFRARFHLRGRDAATVELRGTVFVAQHATATCCRSCLERWHGIPKGRELTEDELSYAVRVICRWIETDPAAAGRRAPR